jgi:hypothetical protein
MVLFLSREYLDRLILTMFSNNTVYPIFHCSGVLWDAKHYCTAFRGSKDQASTQLDNLLIKWRQKMYSYSAKKNVSLLFFKSTVLQFEN